MLTEKDMEDAIAQNPKKYLGEDGLELIERQYRIGGYIFDLLFKDRHGAKLIVEIQKGTLDREHTYKILDYYDGFREEHPKEFIELMVLANRIPEERKKRLRSWGVEFHEIPESDFMVNPVVVDPIPVQRSSTDHVVQDVSHKIITDSNTIKSYELFKEQKNKFLEEIQRINGDVAIKLNWNKLNDNNITTRTNWFIVFIPSKWGTFKGGRFGIHFGFIYYRDKKTNVEYIRLPVGVEKPLGNEYHKQFKIDVVNTLNHKGINIPKCRIWPDVGFGRAKLIEPELTVLGNNSWKIVLNKYIELGEFVDIVANTIRQYYEKKCFGVELNFPA